ncbi:MAG: AsmA family protein [Porticoccaceae bacterium]|nr:AsmA family protein [Porticoccaceae bacterium]MBT6320158.1 AsmA family protein [Porticoccaceae bacterium]
MSAAILYLSFAVDLNSYKTDIESVARQQGWDISIEGDLAWQFFPKPGLSIADITASDQTALSGSADQLILATYWTQLLSLSGGIEQLQLDSLHIEGGSLQWSPANSLGLQFDNIQLSTKNLSVQGKSFPLSVSAKILGGRNLSVETEVAVKLDGQNMRQLNLVDLELNLDSLRLSGELRTSDNGSFMQGNLKTNSFDLKQLMASLQAEIPLLTAPKTVLQSALTQLSLTTSFSVDTQAASKFTGEINLDGQIFGLDVTLDHPTNNLTTLVSGDILRAGHYLPAANSGGNNTGLFAPLAIPFALWQGSSQVEVNLNRVEFKDFNIENFYSNVFGNQRVLRMTSLNADLFAGQINAIAKLDMRSAKPSFNLQPSLYNIDLNKVLSALGGESIVAGRLNMDANIQGVGANLGEIIRSLSGAGKFQVIEPIYKGLNIEQSFCNAAALLSARAQAAQNWPQGTEFNNLQGSFQLSGGKLLLNDYSTGTGNLEIMGRGSVNLVKRQYQINASARVDQAVTSPTGCSVNQRLQNRQIPFICKGAFGQSNPGGLSCNPDEQLLRDLLKNTALEKLFGNSGLQQQDATDSVKGFISELLKR